MKCSECGATMDAMQIYYVRLLLGVAFATILSIWIVPPKITQWEDNMGQAKRKQQDIGLKCVQKLGFSKSSTFGELERKAKKYLSPVEAANFIGMLKKGDGSYTNKMYASPSYAMFFADAWDSEIIRNEINFVDANKETLGNTITDIGCGNGLVDCMLGLLYPEKRIFGYDIDENAINIANEMAKKYNVPNVKFFVSNSDTEYEQCDTLLLLRLNMFVHIRNKLNALPEFSCMPVRLPYDLARKFRDNSVDEYMHLTNCLKPGGLILSVERNHYKINEDFEYFGNSALPRAVDGLSLALVLNDNGICLDLEKSFEREMIDGGTENMPFYFLMGKKIEEKLPEKTILKKYISSLQVVPEYLMGRARSLDFNNFKARILIEPNTAWIIDLFRESFVDGYSLGDAYYNFVKKELWKCNDQYMIYQDGYGTQKSLIFFTEPHTEDDVLRMFQEMRANDKGIIRDIHYLNNLEIFNI